jgi:L-ascorbate metabolism protein UlaG (beta-lactamase superfamily)
MRPFRHVFRRVLPTLVVLLLFAGAVLSYMLRQVPPMEPWESLNWNPNAAGETEPTLDVTFLGVSTVLLSDGQTAILTDGFFSRPPKMRAFLGQVEPDLDGITRGLLRAGIPHRSGKIAAVIPLHSHYDHAMDAPEVAKRTGALLVGSESTANVGRGWGLPESQIRVAKLGQPMKFGRFTITLYPGRHAPTGFTGGEITEPLKPPVRASAYKEGQSYVMQVQHDGRSLLILGSAGFEPGALKNVRAEVVMLGIGALGMRGDDYRDALWREVVAGVRAQRVIPIHWDDFWIPSDQPMRPMPVPLDRFEVTMDFLRARGAKEGIDIRLPAEWLPMDVFTGLPPPR